MAQGEAAVARQTAQEADRQWFRTRRGAPIVIEAWRRRYDAVRPHSSLSYSTPVESSQRHHLHPLIPSRAISRESVARDSQGRSRPAPGIVEDIARGRQPVELPSPFFVEVPLPDDWNAQRAAIGGLAR